ncbi:MAG: OB-fold domain-containing protein [bacterium]
MVGIKSYGVYIPRYRLTGALLREAWGSGPAKGERALANHDEDALTMAVDAVENCLMDGGVSAVDAVYFASASAPYLEKSCATTIAAVADVREDGVAAADFGGSLRAGTAALRAAADAVVAGSAREAVVAAADCRLVAPGHPLEGVLGDAAAALLISADNPIAVINRIHSVSAEFMDIWRCAGDKFLKFEDAKFILEKGYGAQLKRALDGLLDRCGLARDAPAKVVFYAPDAAGLKAQTKALKVKPEALLEDPLLDTVGNAGNAAPFLALAAALDSAEPGDRIVMLGYGGGADAVLVTATEAIRDYDNPRGLRAHLAARRELPAYTKYLRFRKLIDTEEIFPFSPYPLVWREQKANLARYGKKCNRCGTFSYPPQRVCRNCDAKDDFTDEKLSRTGKVFTFAKDHLFPSADPPVVMVSADMDGGGRLYAQLTDAAPDSAGVGMKVELCFRKLHEGGEHFNYFWKFRPPLIED